MSSDTLTLVTWTPKQQMAAKLLAIGYAQQGAADQVGVTQRSIAAWLTKPEFVAYVQRLHEIAWDRIEPRVAANLELALNLQRDMFLGVVEPDDKRYREARRFIDRMVDKLFYLEQAPADRERAGSVTVPIQINTNGARPDGA